MMTLEQAFHLAVQHHQAGRLAEAEALYRQILAVHPDHPDALHLLGTIAHQVGRHDLAVEWIQHALHFNPNFAAAHYNLGNALRKQGRLDEAVAAYQRAIELTPEFAEAHHNLGSAFQVRGQLVEAIAAYRRAVELKPDFAEAHNNLGTVFQERGQFGEAIAAYRRATELRPDYAEAHNNLGLASYDHLDEAIAAFHRAIELNPKLAAAHYNLGNACRDQTRLDEAIDAYRRALALAPDYAEAHNNLGATFKEREQIEEAIVEYRRALALKPDFAEAHHNLGIVFKERGEFEEALAACRQALASNPGYAEAHNNLGSVFQGRGQFDEAIAAYRRVIELKPDYAEAHNNLGLALAGRDQMDEAVAEIHRALALNPNLAAAHYNLGTVFKERGELAACILAFRKAVECDSQRASVHSNLIFALHFDPQADDRTIAAEQRRWNQRFSAPLQRFVQPHTNDRDPDRRLKIGYVSPDLYHHVAGRNVLPLFQHHDHRGFEIVCYSGTMRADELTSEFRRHADLWRSTVGVADNTLAATIRQDGVDILVDLAQHAAGNRLPVFARQPAPVQVSFAGYPESSGLDTIEHRISDRYLEEDCITGHERVFLLDSFWCYDPLGTKLEVNELPAREAGRVTFGCLSHFSKCNDSVLRLWARVLGQVKDSRLVILCAEGSHRQRILQIFQRENIETRRVEFQPRCSHRDYLDKYHGLDIVLDPFPYNGHTTSLDALWMGVPVVSLAGETRVSRGGLSILSNLAMPELVAQSEDEYLAIATRLAHNLPRLEALRRTLRPRMEASVLMDAPHFARSIEAAYRAMWRRWCAEKTGP